MRDTCSLWHTFAARREPIRGNLHFAMFDGTASVIRKVVDHPDRHPFQRLKFIFVLRFDFPATLLHVEELFQRNCWTNKPEPNLAARQFQRQLLRRQIQPSDLLQNREVLPAIGHS